VEALLAVFLPDERTTTYRYTEIRSTDHLTDSAQCSWSCLADTFSAVSPYLRYMNLRIATETQPSHNKIPINLEGGLRKKKKKHGKLMAW